MNYAVTAVVVAFALAGAVPRAQTTARQTLDIYVVDTEGGKAALFITPSGETVLIDAGNPGGRDTDRLMQAIAHANVSKIDHLISTHYHVDHVGGIPELAKRIPIAHYVDHGPTVETREQVGDYQQTYAALYGAATHTVVKPGDRLAVAGLDWRIVTAAAKAITTPLPGGGQANPECAGFVRSTAGEGENNQSVGSVVKFGQFTLMDLGDLMWNNEFDLACPRNLVGPVDLYMVTHHGLDLSGSPALVRAINPRVALMQNGPRKGGAVKTYQTLRSAPALADIWQLHWSYAGMIEHNPAGVTIANIDEMPVIAGVLTAPPPAPRGAGAAVASAGPAAAPPPATPDAHVPAYWIKVSASTDGSFVVSNSRNDYTRRYPAR